MSLYVYLEPDRDRLAQIGDDFRSIGAAVVHSMADLEAHLPRYPETLLVVVGATVDLDEALMFAAYQRLQRPLIGVVLVRKAIDPDDVLRCLRAGVREVIEEDDGNGLRMACARSVDVSKALSSSMGSSVDNNPYGRVVTVFTGKGGCGRTFVAVNLAVALAAGGRRRILLVDLDLQFGDVGIMLTLVPERGIAGALPVAGRIDEPALRSLITGYRPGLDVLLAPANPADGEQVRRELIVEILDVARPLYDFIVVDTPGVVTDQVLASLDVSDRLVSIVTPDLPTLKNARLTAEMFNLLDYHKDRRLLIFNRSNTQVDLTAADVTEALGMPIAVELPFSRDVPLSINNGEPISLSHPAHPVSRAIRELAERCAGAGAGTEPVRRRRLFGRRKGTR